MSADPFDHCQEIARRSGSSFLVAFHFLPAERRRALTALYAFCRLADDIVDEAAPDGADHARARLEEWRHEIGRAYGLGHEAPHTPVGAALAQICPEYDLPIQQFYEILDGMAMDLPPVRRYADSQEVEHYCYHAAGTVGLLSARIFGHADKSVLIYARTLGIALQRINILRDVGEDWQRGRLYLPQDALDAHGVTEADFTAAEPSPGLLAVLQGEADRARDLYHQALASLPTEARSAQRPGLTMGAVYLALLDKIEAQGFPVLHRRVRLSSLQKIAIAARMLTT